MGVNHWLMRYEQLATGCFEPVGFADARLDTITDASAGRIEEYIRTARYAMICLNDSPQLTDIDTVRTCLTTALAAILPEKSDFEL
jgi:peptide methionine sulfoxide reductase MsrA